MRSHRRPGPLEHVLVAGDVTDLEHIAATLALLPETAYGQAYVECPAGSALPRLTSPARVTVTRLERAVGAQRGSLLNAAIDAWRSEWMPEVPEPAREVSMWTAELGSWV